MDPWKNMKAPLTLSKTSNQSWTLQSWNLGKPPAKPLLAPQKNAASACWSIKYGPTAPPPIFGPLPKASRIGPGVAPGLAPHSGVVSFFFFLIEWVQDPKTLHMRAFDPDSPQITGS